LYGGLIPGCFIPNTFRKADLEGIVVRTNWSGNYTYTAPQLHRPRTIEQVQEIVAAASSLRVLGSTHSFNAIADDVSAQISLDGLPHEVEIDVAARTVSFAANMRYGDLGQILERAGWALHNLASLPHISVAGAIATATHGSGVSLGNLSTAVRALRIVRADGNIVSVDSSHPDFAGIVVGLGAFGVVTRITLAIEPTYLVTQNVFLGLGWESVQTHFDEIMTAGYSVSMFTDWSSSGVQQVWVKSRTGAVRSLLDALAATAAQHPILGAPAEFSTQQLAVPGPWNQRLPHFRFEFTPSSGEEIQSEYLLPRSAASAVIEALRAISDQFQHLLLVSEIRTVAADDLWMSTAYLRDSVAIHFTWVRDQAAVEQALLVIEAALAPFEPRPHWGKVFDSFVSSYPRIGEFSDAVTRWDPQRVFRNAYLDRVLEPAKR
jgi:xylitol oxidase